MFKRMWDAAFVAAIILGLYWSTYEIMVYLQSTGKI